MQIGSTIPAAAAASTWSPVSMHAVGLVLTEEPDVTLGFEDRVVIAGNESSTTHEQWFRNGTMFDERVAVAERSPLERERAAALRDVLIGSAFLADSVPSGPWEGGVYPAPDVVELRVTDAAGAIRKLEITRDNYMQYLDLNNAYADYIEAAFPAGSALRQSVAGLRALAA